MAPIYSTAIGVNPLIIDDPRLKLLLQKLNEFKLPDLYIWKQQLAAEEVLAPVDIAALIATVEPHQSWVFEEQVDLHEWINALNAIDACIAYFIKRYPAVLLIEPVKRSRGRGVIGGLDLSDRRPAESMEDAANVPDGVIEQLSVLLRFLSALLRNSSSKSVFNSVEELVDLLAAADDSIASLALEVLCHLAAPPSLHKQQSPEVNQHTTGLHTSKTSSHRRLIALARGWGTRGSGLGLYTCVTADDSEFGQGSLPAQAGDLDFAFSTSPGGDDDNNDFQLVRIHLAASEILEDTMQTELQASAGSSDEDMAKAGTVEASKKRRRVGPVGSTMKETKSTAELFLMCLEKAGGRDKLPEDRLFSLLADIRLARAFYSHSTRVEAVDRRLRAVIAILHSHPSQEIMSGYFQAQPELCVELIDLLRPTVSSTNVSAASAATMPSPLAQDALGALSSSPNVAYGTRTLAVEALTALVGRRDGTNGALTGSARHSSVLTELGVGKGQYLGLLPTLLRYSLASLGSSFSEFGLGTKAEQSTMCDNTTFEIGLAFVEATSSPPAPRIVQLERALEFIDSVLTLTSAIVSTPTGTSALTDCGLIPALLATAAMDSQSFIDNTLPQSSSYSTEAVRRVKSLLRFITAQAIQILEGAIVTHSNALSAFHDLQGVEVLTSRLSREVVHTKKKAPGGKKTNTMECDSNTATNDDVEMDGSGDGVGQQRILSSQRVLLFSIVTCLTVVFHQESTSSSAAAPSGGAQLRKPGLTQALIDILDDVNSFGGHLASLIATLISDVLNSDPHVVHHVHTSGLAQSFINMILGNKVASGSVEKYQPILPPVPELIMALPNVISALSLTEDGAKKVKEANPFPSMLCLFHHPSYAMPKSRCLLNEMTAIVGTGLDEVMRHVIVLKPLVLAAITDALNHIVSLAQDLAKREEETFDLGAVAGNTPTSIENERTCLMQYVLNFGQLLEQILHNEDHCEPFVTAGGLDALLRLFPSIMPTGYQFLSHVSSLSCPSVSTLQHSTTEESLSLAFKCISVRYDPLKLIQKTINAVNLHYKNLQDSEAELHQVLSMLQGNDPGLVVGDLGFLLEGLGHRALHHFSLPDDEVVLKAFSKWLSAVTSLQWITGLLGTAIKTACQRSQESGAGWNRTDLQWKKELTTNSFELLVRKLADFHQSCTFDVCRIRSAEGFLERERERLASSENMRYRLRIVCPEGAVVRDGIEIDSCASVGNMEMGEIAEAFDRCINASGILRYRTHRGWVSEMTRGHGREPISEVLTFWSDETARGPERDTNNNRIEAPIPDLTTVAASVLARAQTSYQELFCALSRAAIHGVRNLPSTSLNFQNNPAGLQAATSMKILASNIQRGFDRKEVVAMVNALDPATPMNAQGVSMYLGCLLGHLQACLFEEKRERRMVNVPLLLSLMETTSSTVTASRLDSEEEEGGPSLTFLDAAKFIFLQSLRDFESRSTGQKKEDDEVGNINGRVTQPVDRTIAASLPPAISLLQKLVSGPLISSSPTSAILSRFKRSDLSALLGKQVRASGFNIRDNDEALFSPESFVRRLSFSVSEVAREAWIDPKFMYAPPHIVHPFATLVREIIGGLEEASKKKPSSQSRTPRSEGSSPFDVFRGSSLQGRLRQGVEGAAPPDEAFEPSEEAVSRLLEMGFTRDHALDALESTRSNRVEIAMEYALSHAPSPSTVQRRRAEREERERQREELRSQAGAVPGGSAASALAGDAAGANGEAMDVEPQNNGDEPNQMKLDGKPAEPLNLEEDDEARAKALCKMWIKDAPRVASQVLSGLKPIAGAVGRDEGGEGDGEREALTVVLCSFLLDLCQRYPEESNAIVTDALVLLKAQIDESTEGGETLFWVRRGTESSVAALCHAAVLFTRALPKTRSLVLKENLVHRMVSCTNSFLKRRMDPLPDPEDQKSPSSVWPMWLAPAILLLDVMAQPVVAFSDKKDSADEKNGNPDQPIINEYDQVKEDHLKQSEELTDMAAKIFAALQSPAAASKSDGIRSKEIDNDKEHQPSDDMVDAQETNESSTEKPTTAHGFFSAVPAFFPLLPLDSVGNCVDICLGLLKRGEAPPGVVHAVLLLLLRLLRTPKTSAHCLEMGTAETILSLPKECRFTGNSGLVTLILRRLLEDEATLQAAMETEIRGTVVKLHGKRRETLSANEKPTAPTSQFTQAVIPMLTRHPLSFLKAFMLSVKVEFKSSDSTAEGTVSLLSTDERSRNLKCLSDVVQVKRSASTGVNATGKYSGRRRSASLSRQRGSGVHVKSKSPSPRGKRTNPSKKHKRDKSDDKHHHHQQVKHAVFGSPANYISSLLIAHVMSSCSTAAGSTVTAEAFEDDSSFLWTANLLEILADLVLSIPACASAVHKYRLSRGKEKNARNVADVTHALSGCPPPPKTFLSFLLHTILPQDRWSIRNDQEIWQTPPEGEGEETDAVVAKKKRAFRLTRVSQTAARLLVALVARPGEGRKRVVSELTFALSGGRLGNSSTIQAAGKQGKNGSARELLALQAWGELCLGLAAPRSNGKNPEGNSQLSFEVIKLMLEYGMAHALLFAVHFVKLHHPMASSTCAYLLLPLELLTRTSVSDAVQAIADKEASAKETKGARKKGDSKDKVRDAVMVNDETMLEEAFHDEPATNADNEFHESGNEDLMHDEEHDDEQDEDDVDMEVEHDGEDDEISSSSSVSEEESSEEEESEEDHSDGEDEGSILEDDEDESESSEGIEDDGDWNMNYRDEVGVANQEFDDAEDDELERAEDGGLDEGWTRIESSGFGGMILGGGGRRHGFATNNAPMNQQTRGFIDAAEAMIGTLLRTGEIGADALADLEGSLGIRIMTNGRNVRAFGMDGGDNPFGGSVAVRLAGADARQPQQQRNEVLGTLPHVHQRDQPGVGYSALGGGGRWIETSSMEQVFGGSTITAGSRNYDLRSPGQNEAGPEAPLNMSQLDLQLFPGGPAAAAHARTQHSLHPLLCGVDLPPVNALVSNLLPHGVRSTRRGQMTTRQPGEWTNGAFSTGNFLMLTSTGTIMRQSRSHSGSPLSLVSGTRAALSGPVGWTDDGLPFDATVEQFTAAFDVALRDSMVSLSRADADVQERLVQPSDSLPATGLTVDDPPGENSQNDGAATTPGRVAADGFPPEEVAGAIVSASTEEHQTSASTEQAGAAASPEDSQVGDDHVASLAESLRLSEGENSPVAAAEPDEPADAQMNDAEEISGSQGDGTSQMDVQQDPDSPAGQGSGGDGAASAQAEQETQEQNGLTEGGRTPNTHGLVCPPDIDEEVFNSLPVDMQRDCIEQHRATQELAAQLDAGSSFDPEALAALPEDLRREVIAQEQEERRQREQAPADPSNAEDMDNASFLASLTPELRNEVLLTADDQFINSLPQSIVAEAQLLRERAVTQHRRLYDETGAGGAHGDEAIANVGSGVARRGGQGIAEPGAGSIRRKSRSNRIRVDQDRENIVYLPPGTSLTQPVAKADLKALLRLLYLLSPVRPSRLLQKVFQNLSSNAKLRAVLASVFVKLMHEDDTAGDALEAYSQDYSEENGWRKMVDDVVSGCEFPPKGLLGTAPFVLDTDVFSPNITLMRRKQGISTAAAIAANLPTSAGGSRNEQELPPVVATRIADTLLHLCKNSPRFCLHSVVEGLKDAEGRSLTSFDLLLDLLEKQKTRYLKSSANLEQLLTLLEACVSPLSHLSKLGEDKAEVSQKDIDAAAAVGKVWLDVPRIVVSQRRLQLLCSVLRMEACREVSFTKVNTIVRRLCRVDANRGIVLAELAQVAHSLGCDAVRDLKALRMRMDGAVAQHKARDEQSASVDPNQEDGVDGQAPHVATVGRSASSTVTLSTSTSEVKLLRVLQTLQALCADSSDDQAGKKSEGAFVTDELVQLLHAMKLDALWDELSACLKVVQVLEGVSGFKDDEDKAVDAESNDDASGDENGPKGKKLKNSAAGLLTRFLPSIEAFFVANASSTRESVSEKPKAEAAGDGDIENGMSTSGSTGQGEAAGKSPGSHAASGGMDNAGLEKLVGGKGLVKFAAANKVLLNALVRTNPGLLDKGLRGLVHVPQCRVFLDFDVKRQWFKTQVRRLRQHASRRHGSLRLHIRRKHVFEDAYHQLRLRNADEMRGRLHITFRNEEGVDAGGLSREFFGILAKEIFNPDYALFTSTEDGCTFQPNANSSINHDHLSYFRFVGRIVGKAVADGFLLDAHFTRSLYKHMLGLKPTHHDMEAIDPDYYRNLKTILEYPLSDIGLELNFSIEDHSFGLTRTIDLIPNGGNVAVTDENKEKYVSLVCQHRMTTAISSQIKSYLDGFYELVSPELIAIFTPKEVELLISGLPDIDVNDLKKNTDYVGWKATDKEIEWFWNAIFSLSRNEKAAFLQFVTGSSKVPLAGFSELQGMRGVQKFSIHKAGGTNGALMSAHTCFNSLDLPVYKSEEELREKLLYAINEGAGAFMFA